MVQQRCNSERIERLVRGVELTAAEDSDATQKELKVRCCTPGITTGVHPDATQKELKEQPCLCVEGFEEGVDATQKELKGD